MRVDCHKCGTQFIVADEQVREPRTAVQCTRCGCVFRVTAEAPARPAAPESLVECRRCHTVFKAALPEGTEVQCSRCGLVFKTPRQVDDDVQVDLPRIAPALHVKGGPSIVFGTRPEIIPEPTAAPPPEREPFSPIMAPAPLPDALREIGKPTPGAPPRRWFNSRAVDLIIWLDEHGAPKSFRLCYDKQTRERAVTWSEGKFAHALVDSGEKHDGPAYKQGAMLLSDVEFDAERVLAVFEAIRANVPAPLARFVAEKLRSRVTGVLLPKADDDAAN